MIETPARLADSSFLLALGYIPIGPFHLLTPSPSPFPHPNQTRTMHKKTSQKQRHGMHGTTTYSKSLPQSQEPDTHTHSRQCNLPK